MPFEGRGDEDFEARVGGCDSSHDLREVAFQVEPQGEEVGDDDDALDALLGEAVDGAGEVGLAEFEEGRCDMTKRTQFGELAGDRPDAVIGALDAGAVGEDDEAGGHREAGGGGPGAGREIRNEPISARS